LPWRYRLPLLRRDKTASQWIPRNAKLSPPKVESSFDPTRPGNCAVYSALAIKNQDLFVGHTISTNTRRSGLFHCIGQQQEHEDSFNPRIATGYSWR